MFDNVANLLGKSISNDRAYTDKLKNILEKEFNAAIDKKFSSLNLSGSSSTDPSVLSRLSAVEQALQSMGASLTNVEAFEADEAANKAVDEQDVASVHTRLSAVEAALSGMSDALTSGAAPLTDLPGTDTPSGSASDSSDSSGGGSSSPSASPAPGSATNDSGGAVGTGSQGFDPVLGGSDNASPTTATPAFAQVNGNTAVTAAPTEIAPGTGQFVDPHATNPAAVATGAPAPVSGSASQPGGDTSAVAADAVPNSTEATRSAPKPTAPNVASPASFDPVSARANPAPFANTEQDAPKAPIINAVPSKMNNPSEAVPVSANTSTAGGVGSSDKTAAS